MGLYLNPLTDEFTGRVGARTFIDHTGMLELVSGMVNDKDRQYIAVSRPRRFGKTVDANMVAAFFDKNGSQKAFQGLEISRHPETCGRRQGKYNVIKIDMSKGLLKSETVRGHVAGIENEVLSEAREQFPGAGIAQEQSLCDALEKVYAKSLGSGDPEQFVIVIDEWDAPLRLRREDAEGHRYYIGWLNDLFKGKGYLALAYMTGILPIKKYGDDSFMNMFDEYSMIDPGCLAPYMGFTEEDVAVLCGRYGKGTEAYRRWYNGYLMTQMFDTDELDENGDAVQKYVQCHVYNPKSVTKALEKGRISDYWNKTGSFESLQEMIDMDVLGLRTAILEMMNGERKPVSVKAYRNNLASLNSLNQVFTLLVHLGYLTYDAEKEEVFIPNRELMEEFAMATTEDAPVYLRLQEIIGDSLGLLKATWEGNADRVAEAIEKSHSLVCAPKDYNSELALSTAVSFAYYSARACYTVIPEAPAGKGYADLTFIPVDSRHPAMVVELKWNKDARTAIDQIRDKNYTGRLENYAGNILCVGISYEKTDAGDPQYKKHSCIIEQL